MNIKINKVIILLLLIGSLVFIISLIAGFQLNNQLADIELCKSCHDTQPYYSSYLDPQNGSLIKSHKLDCLQCHANKSIEDAKRTAAIKVIQNRLNVERLSPSLSGLKVNCIRCHTILTTSIHNDINNTGYCTDCHWAHQTLGGPVKATSTNIILYGFHRDQNCQNCHGTTFKIPRCVDCHAGHGEQKLENNICLKCHINPHTPEKPGILPNNTVSFTGNMPFSICKPCHENEYFGLQNSLSKHLDMQTCTQCHKSHGSKPECNNCHTGMMTERHPDYFECKTCHKTFNPVKIKCQDCHGRSHEWGAFTAILNPQ